MRNFAQFVKGIRDSSGMSQEKLAESLGVGTTTVYNWESGRTKHATDTEVIKKLVEMAKQYSEKVESKKPDVKEDIIVKPVEKKEINSFHQFRDLTFHIFIFKAYARKLAENNFRGGKEISALVQNIEDVVSKSLEI